MMEWVQLVPQQTGLCFGDGRFTDAEATGNGRCKVFASQASPTFHKS